MVSMSLVSIIVTRVVRELKTVEVRRREVFLVLACSRIPVAPLQRAFCCTEPNKPDVVESWLVMCPSHSVKVKSAKESVAGFL